jgi:hypothetical protein
VHGANSQTSKNSGFSTASFVSSTGASNDVAIDDPDFWSKVVGLASSNGFEAGFENKRKCRDNVSYKEPGVNSKFLNPLSESDTSSDEEGVTKPADFSVENLNTLMSAIVSRGYCNWDSISIGTRLKWNIADISQGSRYCILQLLYFSCLNATECKTQSQEVDQLNFEDINIFQSNMRKFKCCRLALAANFLSSNDKEFKNMKPEDSVESHIIKDLLERMRNESESILLPCQYLFQNNIENNILSEQWYLNNYSKSDLVLQNVVRAILDIRNFELPLEFKGWDIDKVLKIRASSRAKLQQIEDMFDIYLFANFNSGSTNTGVESKQHEMNSLEYLSKQISLWTTESAFWKAEYDIILLNTAISVIRIILF